jgi:uncharacterized protein GlcG (DUF336 family)
LRAAVFNLRVTHENAVRRGEGIVRAVGSRLKKFVQIIEEVAYMARKMKAFASKLAFVALGAASVALAAPAVQAEGVKSIAKNIRGTVTELQTKLQNIEAAVAAGNASDTGPCAGLPSHDQLQAALRASVAATAAPSGLGTAANPDTNGGLDIPMWATLVARDGTVCAVTFSGAKFDDQWPASRAISAQKANTANALTTTKNGPSIVGSADVAGVWSTAMLYSAVQPGGSLFGLQESNPVNPIVAYQGSSEEFGKVDDPMVGRRIGGINVFGGGVALFDSSGKVIGGLGVSGDTSCADHNIAWRTRKALALNNNPKGPTADNIIFDIDPATGKSASGFGHPTCLDAAKEKSINAQIVAQ